MERTSDHFFSIRFNQVFAGDLPRKPFTKFIARVCHEKKNTTFYQYIVPLKIRLLSEIDKKYRYISSTSIHNTVLVKVI